MLVWHGKTNQWNNKQEGCGTYLEAFHSQTLQIKVWLPAGIEMAEQWSAVLLGRPDHSAATLAQSMVRERESDSSHDITLSCVHQDLQYVRATYCMPPELPAASEQRVDFSWKRLVFLLAEVPTTYTEMGVVKYAVQRFSSYAVFLRDRVMFLLLLGSSVRKAQGYCVGRYLKSANMPLSIWNG